MRFTILFLTILLANTLWGQDAERYAIAIHGGAGSSPKSFSIEANQKRRASMKKALEIGTDILKKGGTSLDAVEQVVLFLENDAQFNAGKGAVFNAAGRHELDASIMDGNTKACGAVAGVTTVQNPISLARLVMTNTRHVLLAGPGADQFALEMKIPFVENTSFQTKEARAEWERSRSKKPNSKKSKNEAPSARKGTVGCVALDHAGNLAAATSTGGLTNKQFGRVGDSPIIGAGTYADNATCAVSCTGVGEEYIRHAIAYDVSARLRYANESLEQAVDSILKKTLKPGYGGMIAVGKEGEIVMGFNTGGMARAAADSEGRFEVLWPDK